MGLIIDGVPVRDLVLDGQSVPLYIGGNPPTKVWPTRDTVQITLGTDLEARDQFRAALADRGLDYTTVTEIPFDIELVGTGSVRDMFRGCRALTSVPDMDTSGVTNMRSMFNACNALTSVPPMDTSQVTNMAWMFTHCYALTTIPAMDTSQVTTMNNMFDYSLALTSVPDLDTSQVTNMSHMLFGCSSLTDGNVRLIGRHPQVDTTKMIDGSGLTFQPFVETVQITLGTGTQARDQLRAALTARGLDYRTVTRIPFDIELVGTGSAQNMFEDCRALTSVPAMDTSQVTNMSYMFYNCRALTDGNVRLIGKHPQVSTTGMLTGSGLTREPFVETVQITLGAGFAARDQFRAELTARGLDYTTITELPFAIELVGTGEAIQLFRDCHALISVPPLDTSQVTNANGMFQECHSLVTVPPLDTSNVVRAPSMFAYCRSLTSVPTMDAEKMIDVTNMFTGCVALTDGNVLLMNRNPAVNSTNMITSSGLTREPWDTVQITLGSGLEARDQLRAALTARGLDYRTVTRIPFDIEMVGTGMTWSMFNGCESLTHVPAMDTSQVTDMYSMFNGCRALTYVPDMDTSQVTSMHSMFSGCAALTSVPDMDTAQVTDMGYMFYNCKSLTDGNVRLIGRHPQVDTTGMTALSGLTREPLYDTNGNPI